MFWFAMMVLRIVQLCQGNWSLLLGGAMKSRSIVVGLVVLTPLSLHATDVVSAETNLVNQAHPAKKSVVSERHQTCLYDENGEGLIYAERNLAHFHRVNNDNILFLYQRGVINGNIRKDPDDEERVRLKAILQSFSNIAYDARERPDDLKRDLEHFGDVVFSTTTPYTLRDKNFKTVEDLKKSLQLLNELLSFRF